MGNTYESKSRWQRLAGHATVASVLLLSLWLSYGCGTQEEPRTVRSTVQSTSDGRVSAATTPRATAVSTETVEPAPEPVRAPVTFEEAELVFHDGRFEEATDLFLVYVNDHPNNVWGHYMAGLSAWKAGVLVQAESSFEHALAIDSGHVKSMLNLSRVLLDQGRPEDATGHIERVLELDSESVDGHRLMGRAKYDLGDPEGAMESYRQAIIRDPEDAWSMNNLGLILIREERFEEALPVLALATEIRNDIPTFFNNLGIALERTDCEHAAADAFDHAVELDPAYEKAMQNLARVEARNDGSDVRTVDLSVLADEFRREVAEWQKPAESVSDPLIPEAARGTSN